MFRYKQFTIRQDHAAMKVGTDSDLLGTLSEGGQHVLDIGTGTGVLSLMLAQRYPTAQITAIEIDDEAVKDAMVNFESSPFSDRIRLHHCSFQEYLSEKEECERYDAIVCNPPYFHQSLECGDNIGRTRARHSSSLPFDVLIRGAYELLEDGGTFSVCIPPEVLQNFSYESTLAGFRLCKIYKVRSVPQKLPKRFVLVYRKGRVDETEEYEYCMRNADHSRSEWYKNLMKDFLLTGE